jgi:DNA-binding CsgD family transcriptional regulator
MTASVTERDLVGSIADHGTPDTEPYTWLVDALTKMASARTRSALWSHVKEFAGRFGCCEFTAVDALGLAGGLIDAVLDADTSTVPILVSIESEGLTRTHPVLERCLKAPEPFKLSELRDDPNQAGRRWAELLSDISRRGDVLIVPVYEEGDLQAVFAFGGEDPRFNTQTRLLLQVVSYAAFARACVIDPLAKEANGYKLTVREIQCLLWVAMGKTDAEAGQILGISPRTVRYHIENAKQKFGVATRTQAVAKAVNEKIIQV